MEKNQAGFPWTYDQLQRYAVLGKFLDLFFRGKSEEAKVLDVGGVSPTRDGSSSWLPLGRVFHGQAVSCDVTPCGEKGFVRADGSRLPFKDGSFDVVAAMDVIEHLPEDARAGFIRELCRVAKSAVVLSAPFRDDGISAAEAILSAQIKKEHGVEHAQLREHKERGLPERGRISEMLSGEMAAGAELCYGNLSEWLFLQSFRSRFLFKRGSDKILGLLDRLTAARNQAAEFEPPFSRRFWFYARDVEPVELNRRVETIKEVLLREGLGQAADIDGAALADIFRGIEALEARKSVSAVVVSRGQRRCLDACLNHLLTQNINFDLDVTVWNIVGRKMEEKSFRERFPGIGYTRSDKAERTTNALFRTADGLRGDYLLLTGDNVLLPADTLQKLYDALGRNADCDLLAPFIVWKRFLTPIWKGRTWSLFKFLAGRALLPRFRGDREKRVPGFLFAECLFFRRETLLACAPKRGRLRRRNIFLWEKAGGGEWLLFPTTVFKK